jgi:LuxR family maltose regulon positive regulatory protein
LTCAKVLLAQNTPESLQQAADLLSELYDYYGSIHNTRYLIDFLILQSMIYDSRGDEMIALGKLIEAISLAEPGGFIRPFLDAGPQIL